MKQTPIIPLKSQFYLASVYANGVPGALNCNNLTKAGARKCAGSTAFWGQLKRALICAQGSQEKPRIKWPIKTGVFSITAIIIIYLHKSIKNLLH